MKKSIITFFVSFLILGFQSNAQITLENSYNGTVYQAKTALKGIIYYSVDSYNNQCNLYNLDHSLWKTIDITVPQDNYIYDIQYVSQHLFNEDDLTELIVVIYELKYNTDTTWYYDFTTMIVNEEGEELLVVEGGTNPGIFNTDDSSSKLLIYIYDYSVQLYPLATQVYKLPGVRLAIDESEWTNELSMMDPYPNPSSFEITIPYNLDAGIQTAYLVITDNSGKPINRILIDTKSRELEINTGSYKAGMYLYWIEARGYKSKTKKFIVK